LHGLSVTAGFLFSGKLSVDMFLLCMTVAAACLSWSREWWSERVVLPPVYSQAGATNWLQVWHWLTGMKLTIFVLHYF